MACSFSQGLLALPFNCSQRIAFCLNLHTRKKKATPVQFYHIFQFECSASIKKLLCALITNSLKKSRLTLPYQIPTFGLCTLRRQGWGVDELFYLTDGARQVIERAHGQVSHLKMCLLSWPAGRRETSSSARHVQTKY